MEKCYFYFGKYHSTCVVEGETKIKMIYSIIFMGEYYKKTPPRFGRCLLCGRMKGYLLVKW